MPTNVTNKASGRATLLRWLTAQSAPSQAFMASSDEMRSLLEDSETADFAGLLLECARRNRIRLPEDIRASLHTRRQRLVMQEVTLRCELERVVQTLHAADIPVMLLKGAALVQTIYPAPGTRPMSDLDLLVKPNDACRAIDVLIRHGCRLGYDLMQPDFFPEFHYERELFTDAPQAVRIDLHARPFRPLRVSRVMPDDALWEDAQTTAVGPATAWVPRPELMIIHLAAHAAFHGCERLMWIYDIHRFVESYGSKLDASLLTRKMTEWRLVAAVENTFRKAQELFETEIPASWFVQSPTQQPSWSERLALWQAPRDAVHPVAHVLVNLLTTPGIRFRLRYAMSLLFPGPRHLGHVYPFRHLAWIPCAHVWRALRILGRGLIASLHSLWRVVPRFPGP